jgi:DNA polymerase III gamma/tau subunit
MKEIKDNSMDFVEKYKPRSLTQLIGQTAAINKINGMLGNKRIPHTILITGPKGCGKTCLAYILACLFNDIKYRRQPPDLADFNIGDLRGIDAVREIVAAANYMPQNKYRIILLDEIHRLTTAAAPALLKPIEEGGSQTIWLLVTNNPQNLLPEIIRRCYIINLRQPTAKEVLPLLQKICRKEQIKFPQHNNILRQIAAASQGQPATALHILQGAADANFNKVKSRDIIMTAIQAVPSLANDQLAVKCLVYIYNCKPTRLLENLILMDDTVAFCNALLNMNLWLINYKIGQIKWQSPLTQRLRQYTKQINLPTCIVVHNALITLRGEVQRFIYPEIHLLTARLVDLIFTLENYNVK